jgi:hypothetical protein
MTTAATTNPDVPAPADATKVTEWDRIFRGHELHRFFHGTQRGDVGIYGYQNPDGSVRERSIQFDGRKLDRRVFDAASAGELGEALLALAGELGALEAQR